MMVHFNDRLGGRTSLLVAPHVTIKELKARVAAKLYKVGALRV